MTLGIIIILAIFAWMAVLVFFLSLVSACPRESLDQQEKAIAEDARQREIRKQRRRRRGKDQR